MVCRKDEEEEKRKELQRAEVEEVVVDRAPLHLVSMRAGFQIFRRRDYLGAGENLKTLKLLSCAVSLIGKLRFWNGLSATKILISLATPLQRHHGPRYVYKQSN